MRNKSNYFRRGTKNGGIGKRPPSTTTMVITRVVGEPRFSGDDYRPSHIQRFADLNRRNQTESEQRFEAILANAGGGALKNKYRAQFIVHGKWILDFYIPDIRLGIEIDGASHGDPKQKALDLQKEIFLAEVDITLIRFTNAEVRGDQERVLQRLREVWPIARARTERRKWL